MSALFFALAAEAKPWIQALNAKPDREQGHFRFYHTLEREHSIAITGPGKVAMAMAVTEFAQKIHKSKRKDHYKIWNLGICGSVNSDFAIGDFFWINKVKDASSGRSFYPERIQKLSDHRELAITTFEKPVTTQANATSNIFQFHSREELSDTILVDMEASGFFEAASIYFDLQYIQIGKVVSDHLEGTICDANQIQNYFESNCQMLMDTFLAKDLQAHPVVLDESSWEKYQSIGLSLHFTESMLSDLKKAIIYFKIKHPSREVPNPILPQLSKPMEKIQSKQVFANWKKALYE